MDKVIIKDLKVFAYHGVNPEEKRDGQPFILDITLYMPLGIPCESDDINDTVSYAKALKTAVRVMNEASYNLIEKAASRVAEELLLEFPAIQRVNILLKKPQAPIQAEFSYVAVEIERERDDFHA